MKKVLLFCITSLLLTFCASAQSSEKLSEMIKTEKTTIGQAAYLAAVYQGLTDEKADYSQAVQALASAGYIDAGADPEKPVELAELAYICTRIAGFSGGLMYKMFPGPRYAFRELKAKGFIPPVSDPSETVTGRDTIALFNSCLADKE